MLFSFYSWLPPDMRVANVSVLLRYSRGSISSCHGQGLSGFRLGFQQSWAIDLLEMNWMSVLWMSQYLPPIVPLYLPCTIVPTSPANELKTTQRDFNINIIINIYYRIWRNEEWLPEVMTVVPAPRKNLPSPSQINFMVLNLDNEFHTAWKALDKDIPKVTG